jgi:hypothetical protein
MMDALGIARDLGADHAGRIALLFGTAHPADAGIIDHLDIERAGRRTIVRTGGMPDIDLGVLVHALMVIIKTRENQRNYPACRCANSERAMHYALR